MSIGSRFLNHRVSIARRSATLDEEDEPTFDEYGQPITSETTLASGIAAGIQPKSARELAAISQAGVASSSHNIYMLPRDITTADAIVHDASECPVRTDLPDMTFQVVAVPDAAGAGHHLEIDGQMVDSQQQAYAVPVGEGS